MGNYISSLRAHVISNLGTSRESTTTSASTPATTTTNATTTNTNTIYPASSRLNLINQLIGLGGSAVTSRPNGAKKANGLNDFQNVSFANHFFMAGRRFKNIITQAQTFLFGDQLDLGFLLAHKPIIFPYEIAPIDVPSNYLQSLINIRKDTLKLVKYSASISSRLDQSNNDQVTNEQHQAYNIEFTFDCDCDCVIKIHYFATESYKVENGGGGKLAYTCGCSRFNLNYLSDTSLNHHSRQQAHQSACLCYESPTIYRRGASNFFKQVEHSIVPCKFNASAWQFNLHANYFPIVIECRPVDAKLRDMHAHVTLAYVEKSAVVMNRQTSDENGAEQSNTTTTTSAAPVLYQIKPIKQKQLINGVLFCLQEIYGIERKIPLSSSDDDQQIGVGANLPAIKLPKLSEDQSSDNTTGGSANTSTDGSSSSTSTIDMSSRATTGKAVVNSSGEQDELKGVECVICMCEMRDTLILPCRHFCLCKMCAVNLRVQSNNCPICRIPFLALIQLKLFRRRPTPHRKQSSQMLANPNAVIMHLNRIDETSMNDLPEIKLNHVQLIEEDGVKATESRRIVGDANREVLVSSSAAAAASASAQISSSVGIKTKLNDFYECVSVYEAFNGLLQQSSEHEREVFFAEKRRRSIEAGGASALPRNLNKPRKSTDVVQLPLENSQPQVSQIQCINNKSGIEIKNLNDLKEELNKLSPDIIQDAAMSSAKETKSKVPYQSSSVIIFGATSESSQAEKKLIANPKAAKSLDDLSNTNENIHLEKLDSKSADNKSDSNESINLDSTSKF